MTEPSSAPPNSTVHWVDNSGFGELFISPVAISVPPVIVKVFGSHNIPAANFSSSELSAPIAVMLPPLIVTSASSFAYIALDSSDNSLMFPPFILMLFFSVYSFCNGYSIYLTAIYYNIAALYTVITGGYFKITIFN